MNLQEFTSAPGHPEQKPWLSIVAGSVEGKTVSAGTLFGVQLNFTDELRSAALFVGPTAGAGPVNLGTANFPSCTVIIGVAATGTIVCPLSADIDAKLGTTTDGGLIWQDVINRNPAVGPVNLTPPNAGPNQPIPSAQAGGKSVYTRFLFTRIAGIWTCLNT